MTISLSETELENEVVLQWHANQAGDELPNPKGIATSHPTMLTQGKIRLEIAGQEPQIHDAPVVLMLPVKVPYSVIALTDSVTVHCIYNKHVPGAIEDIQLLRKRLELSKV